VKKEHFIELCKTDPEEVFKLFCMMGETITTLQAQIVVLNEQVESLQAEVKELKARLGQNSKNSNKPPSSDEFFKPKSTRKKNGKKTGGQKGHPGHTLKMSDNPDLIIVHRASTCSDCNCSLVGQPARSRERRQSFDIPVPKKEITEHISETICCAGCGKLNKAEFPPQITQPVQYGPNLLAQLVYLSQYQLIPYNRVVEFVSDIYDLKVSEATVYNAIKTAKVDQLKQKPRLLSTEEKDSFKKRYDHIVAAGYLANPPPEPVKKRGRPKQGKARNMLKRLSEHRHEVLAFMEDYRVDFDNNQAERDLRMVKLS